MSRILIAEDEPAVRDFVTRALERAGHEVVAVADGEKAVTALAQGAFDMLLTDIVMPGMDGIALALKATSVQPGIKVLMMSGYAEERRRAHNLESLVHRVIAKPFSLDDITRAVREVLAA